MKKFLIALFAVSSAILSGCSTIQMNDEQRDEYFLRKQYCLTRVYYFESDIGTTNYINPESIGIDTSNTFVDFYYGGLDFYNKNGPLFAIQFKCNALSDRENTVIKSESEINRTVGKYKLKKSDEYLFTLYCNFTDAQKHLSDASYDLESGMYKGLAFPDYYVRCTFTLSFLKDDQIVKRDAILEFGQPVVVHNVDDKPF